MTRKTLVNTIVYTCNIYNQFFGKACCQTLSIYVLHGYTGETSGSSERHAFPRNSPARATELMMISVLNIISACTRGSSWDCKSHCRSHRISPKTIHNKVLLSSLLRLSPCAQLVSRGQTQLVLQYKRESDNASSQKYGFATRDQHTVTDSFMERGGLAVYPLRRKDVKMAAFVIVFLFTLLLQGISLCSIYAVCVVT